MDKSCSKKTTKVWCAYCLGRFKGRGAPRKHRDDRIELCQGAPDCKRRFFTKEALGEHEKDCELIRRACKASSIGCGFTGQRHKLDAHQLACQLVSFMPQWQAMQERFQQQDESLRAVQGKCQHQEQTLVAVRGRIQQQEKTLTAVQEQKTQLEQKIQGYRTQLEHKIDGVQCDVDELHLCVADTLGVLLRSKQEQLRQRQRDGGSLTDHELRLIDAGNKPIIIDSDEDGDEEQHDETETRPEPQVERTKQNTTRKRKRTAEAEVEDDAGSPAANAARTRSSS